MTKRGSNSGRIACPGPCHHWCQLVLFGSMAKIARAVDASFMVTTTTSLPVATAAPPFFRILLGALR